ncbi:MAG TPA: glycosyltransferase family 4 protein, partial [Candidatus Binatia bacterium]|nr:glycosyltransferase family 4 protein [Candidatus Binatia bacterium]
PRKYGGTELFIAQLAEGLKGLGVDVVVYANGESTIEVETRWLYKDQQWPIRGEVFDNLKDFNHASWAVCDAAADCDVIHLNSVPALMYTRFARENSFVYTMHHVHEDHLTEIYGFFPKVEFVTISDFQRHNETMPRLRTIHHGIDLNGYRLQSKKQDYFCFLGRIAPIKGTHIAIEVAKRTGIPLKMAGEVQPLFRDYFESQIKPHIDGRFIEYVGEADLEGKNELLGNALAMLFPIQWNEPFGLVMIEAMACGTPVLALPGGAVEEVVRNGISGFVCPSADEMVERASALPGLFSPASVRQYCRQYFSVERMVAGYLALYREMTAQKSPVGKATAEVPMVA